MADLKNKLSKYNSKQYKQAGEVEPASPYHLETAQKKTKQNMYKPGRLCSEH